MSSLSETLTYNVLEDDDSKKESSSFVVSDQVYSEDAYIAPQITVTVNTKGIPTETSLVSGTGGYQWHLNDTWGINAHEVWEEYTGLGVKIAVFDDGFDYTHSDLIANYRTDLDFDTAGGNDNDAIAGASDRHGTAVAGVIAADDNGTGVVGVAFDSEIIGIRRDFSSGTFTDTVEGFAYALSSGADVMNNSWGATTIFVDNPIKEYFGNDTTEVIDAMVDLVNLGRGGLGTSIVFSAGNSRASDDNVNYHGYQNSPYNITVAGTDINGEIYDSSTPGAAILVSAGGEGITTTDGSGDSGYLAGDTVYINGTSFSAPIVSGVIALMYEANADLGYRDVQEILAMSSRELTDSAWQTNGNTSWNGRGMHFSHDYGYGLVDAYTAVRLAETWGNEQKTYANMQTVSVSGTPNVAIPDNGTLQHTVTVADDISVEHILLELVVPHERAGNLVVTLISPDGTESILVDTPGSNFHTTDAHGYTGLNFQFSSTAHWGETSAGDWTIRIHDTQAGNVGSLESFNLEFLGSAITDDNTYYFTDEFQAVLIADTVGVDTFNLSAVRGDVTLVMTEGSSSSFIVGETLRIANTTVIENAILGDGNDTVTGNAVANEISTGRGDDHIFASSGDDTIDGQTGLDTITYSGNITDYTIEILDATTIRFTDNLGGGGVDVVSNVETFIFNNSTFTFVEVEDTVTNPPVAENLLFKFGWDGNESNYVSSAIEDVTLTATDLGVSDASGNLVNIDRQYISADITIIDPLAQDLESFIFVHSSAFNLTVSGAKTTNIKLGSATSSSVQLLGTMNGRVETGDGADIIDVQLYELVAPTGIEDYRLIGNDGNDTMTVSGTHSNIRVTAFGGTGDDTITVSVTGNHFLYGEFGNDIINGSNGDERIEGGDGDDQLNASHGDDVVYGGNHNDTIYGGFGDDWLYGDSGSDVLYGEGGNDNMRGGIGVDTLNGGDGNDTLYGEDGNDLLNGGGGRDVIVGGAGDDTINGGDWHDLIYGDSGADTINGDLGNDEIRAGAGNDIVNGGDGIDKLLGGLDDDVIHGNTGNDRIYGEDGLDALYGDDGNDVLYGGNGEDTLIGGLGQDFLYGGNGADTFFLDLSDIDRIRDFQLSEGDRIDISDLLVGYNAVTDDLNDFVKINIHSNFRTDISVNADGVGSDFQYAGIVFGNLVGQTVDSLEFNNDLLV